MSAQKPTNEMILAAVPAFVAATIKKIERGFRGWQTEIQLGLTTLTAMINAHQADQDMLKSLRVKLNPLVEALNKEDAVGCVLDFKQAEEVVKTFQKAYNSLPGAPTPPRPSAPKPAAADPIPPSRPIAPKPVLGGPAAIGGSGSGKGGGGSPGAERRKPDPEDEVEARL